VGRENVLGVKARTRGTSLEGKSIRVVNRPSHSDGQVSSAIGLPNVFEA
jgi:hypothetical protein